MMNLGPRINLLKYLTGFGIFLTLTIDTYIGTGTYNGISRNFIRYHWLEEIFNGFQQKGNRFRIPRARQKLQNGGNMSWKSPLL